MRLSSYYQVLIGPFYFRVHKNKSGNWKASIELGHGWRSVRYPSGGVVTCRTKGEMLTYLRYAYDGEESISR